MLKSKINFWYCSKNLIRNNQKIPDLPNFIDRADYALRLMAEGKLNLAIEPTRSRNGATN